MTEGAIAAEDGARLEGARAEFFAAVREIIAAAELEITAPVIGGDLPPEREPVRFRAAQGAAHPDAEIAALERSGQSGPVVIDIAFMGLTGPSGVMPDHYSELVVARDRARDNALAALLDMFNHRAVSLFYRAWAKYRLPVAFTEAGGRQQDAFSRALAALAGLPTVSNDPRVLGAAGALARRVRSPSALRRTLAFLFGLPVTVQEMRARRLPIEPEDQTRLNALGSPFGTYAKLGSNAVVGATATDVAGHFRLRIGPLDMPGFSRFFAPDTLRDDVVATARQIVGSLASMDIQLMLQADAVPQTRVGAGASASRLGQNSWLIHSNVERDRDDAILHGRSGGGLAS